MDAATWRWARDLIADAVELPPPDRAALLRHRCPDEGLRAEIESLLRRFADAPSSGEPTTAAIGKRLEHVDFEPGHVFAARYRIVSFLGKGGMGEVYRADDLKLQQSVALKFLPPALGTDRDRLVRFTGEVRIAREVSHPNVCRVFDIGESEGLHYISMEYIDGDDLASLLRRVGRLHRDKAVDIARQLCAGLAAAHERGVLHRDLKPGNVLVDSRGRAHIADFGLAIASRRGIGADIAGTPAYMAPEQFSGEPLSEKTDLYALGVVIHELFTGRRSADGAGSRPGDAVVPAIVFQCLQGRPEERPASAADVAAGFADASSVSTPAHAATTVTLQPASLAQGTAWMMLAAAIIGMLVVAYRSHDLTYRPSDVPNPPDALAARAQAILSAADFSGRRTDSEFWFAPNPGGSPPVRFVYRESSSYLLPRNLFHFVTLDDPPEDLPGMATVTVDPSGRLVRFSGIQDSTIRRVRDDAAVDWSGLFKEAGLDARDLVRVALPGAIPVPYDSAVAWQTHTGSTRSSSLGVRAASQNGRAVFFEVGDPNAPAAIARNVLNSHRTRAVEPVYWTLIALAFAAATVLARRHHRSRDADTSVANRLAVFVACGGAIAGMLRAHHVPLGVEEGTLVLAIGGWVLVWTGFTWIAYIAVEPHVRRTWPSMLRSFDAVVLGNAKHPVIGRDILVGLLAGAANIALLLVVVAVRHSNPSEALVFPALQGLRSTRVVLAMVAFHVTDGLQFALAGILFLVVLRLVLRNGRVAALAWVTLVAPLSTGEALELGASGWGWSWLVATCLGLLVLAILFRFGLLAALVMLLFARLTTQSPMTLDVGAWYFSVSLALLLLLGVLAFYAFLVALGGGPSFGDTEPVRQV
jgi:serine/threonine protein kinase